MTDNRISIIGSGWVGAAIGMGFLELGDNVIFYDIIKKKLPNFSKNPLHFWFFLI